MSNFNLDLDRNNRLGFPETIYGFNKDPESLLQIVRSMMEANGRALITKVQPEKEEMLRRHYPDLFYDPVSTICRVGPNMEKRKDGSVAILSGGTSDEPVVNEAFYSLEYMGVEAGRFQDVGVSGLHRLLDIKKELERFTVLIVVAGFEGALPTVVGGLLPQPIIAVPVSVGYGVAHGGVTALHSMLSSCANGVSVVNIDNGYGAAMAAFRIIMSKNVNA